MTCTGCLHIDYCIHFGCPFKGRPQSSSNKGGACREIAQHVYFEKLIFPRRRQHRTKAIATPARLNSQVVLTAGETAPIIDLLPLPEPRINLGVRAGLTVMIARLLSRPLSGCYGREPRVRIPYGSIFDVTAGEMAPQFNSDGNVRISRGGVEGHTCKGQYGYLPHQRSIVIEDAWHVSDAGAVLNSGPREFKFGCVNTDPNLHPMVGHKAITQDGSKSRFWTAGSGVTAATYSAGGA